MSRFTVLLAAAFTVAPALTYAQSQTEAEVRQTILDSYEYTNTHLRSEEGSYSQDGALEFWSSGGLLNEIPAGTRPEGFDEVNLRAKHIQVTTLVEGQAAVAHFYSEGILTPKGGPPNHKYITRVTQVFVKEDGAWKIRASHWSPLTGGSGTSQTVLD
jgi:hypothetical protein